MTALKLKNASEVAAKIEARNPRDTLNLGQIVCLGLSELREELGEEGWARAETLVEKAMLRALDRVLDRDDVYVKTREGDYIVVFGTDDPVRAEAKTAKVSELVKQAVHGEADLVGLRVAGVVSTEEGLAPGGSRDPLGLLASLADKAGSVAIGVNSLSTNTSREAELEAGPEEGETRGADAAVFPEGETRTGYLPILTLSNEKVETFLCVPTLHHAFQAAPETGAGVLAPGSSARQSIDLDLTTFRDCMSSLRDGIEANLGSSLIFRLGFETLCDGAARESVLTALRDAPPVARKSIGVVIADLPPGVPEARLRELSEPLTQLAALCAVELEPRRFGAELAAHVTHIGAAGIGHLYLDLPGTLKKADTTWLSAFGAKKPGARFEVTLTNICSPRTLRSLKNLRARFMTGPLLGGPFDDYTAPYGSPLKDVASRGKAAMARSRVGGHKQASFPAIAKAFGITFAVTKPNEDGDPCFVFLTEAVEELTGYAPAALMGRPVKTLQCEETNDRRAVRFFERLAKVGEASVVLVNRRLDGQRFGNRITAIVAPEAHRQLEGTFYAFLEEAPIPRRR